MDAVHYVEGRHEAASVLLVVPEGRQELDWRRPVRTLPGDRTSGADQPSRPATARPVKKTYTWTCQYCGQPFKSTHYGRRYCSNAHKQAAWRERQR
ncbi:MAG: hypothetical protein HRF47_14715 [Chloroflexota bacterium]